MGCAPLEPKDFNPSSYDDQRKLLSALSAELLKEERIWFWIVVDGAVAGHMQKLAYTEFSCVRVRSAGLHEYLNMMKAWQELAFPVIGRGFAQIMGYQSEKALQ